MSHSRIDNSVERKPAYVDPDSRPWEQYGFKELRDGEDSPKQRIELVSSPGSPYGTSFDMLINAMRLAFVGHQLAPGQIGKGVVINNTLKNGLYTTIELDYRSDLAGNILPRIAALGCEVNDSSSELGVKLQRLAAMAGVAIAESQCFNVGNNRIARATYGWIQKGRDGIIEAHNAVMDFEPPQELEKLILMQNVTRLRDQKIGDTFPDLLGGRYVDREMEESLVRSRENLDVFRNHYGKSNVEWNKFELSKNLALRIGGRETLPEKQQYVLYKALMILFQSDYGPAAYSLVSDDSDLFETFDLDFAEQLIEANTQLLRMRIVSLVSGLANGGQFTGIEDVLIGDPDYGSKTRKITRIDWNPTTSSSPLTNEY